ncbi:MULTISPECIES: acetoin utilization protein AcuC [unclassified Ruegeria]|uniref:acetoin utilization protein AcuC n=1 Tax=unclassified Ruegeria TaxID=2625375 RepID=UPI001488D030|nr:MULTISPECIES: acetoin utilization protein AcuC [unclassified Ruegeria]NOD87308.1 acetoin utilization protein AcuC [Ruegeria sp. HKCCD4318]NOE12863.1 acetoin utilization protein AcuC [Ruegeria sp. HKCCD4318-2]NOG08970.1 acetoin utilization protein AcuC [Ruegeria sp. HKCCD4315]
MQSPIFIGSEIYRNSTYGSKHPLAIPRVSTVIDLCRALGWLTPENYRVSPCAKPSALETFHAPDYIAALQKAEQEQYVSDQTRERYALGTLSNPVFPEMYRRPATAAGGSMLAAELIRDGGIVFNPAGGTHHGLADRANGFCYLNDPVLAIQTLLNAGLDRVVYVDIDAHHCDGVEVAFHGSTNLRMISMHEARRWPFTGNLDDDAGGAAFNLPVARGLNDNEFSAILDELILPATAAFKPQAIILQCGADAVTEDPLSRLTLSNSSHWNAVAALKELAPRFLVLGGGGYNPWSVGRLWTGVWATLNGFDIPDRLDTDTQTILRALTWNRSVGRNPPSHWLDELRDIPNFGPIQDELKQDLRRLAARISW